MRRPLNDCLWRQLNVKTKPVEYNNYCPPQPKSWVVLVLVMAKRIVFYVGASWVCEWQQKEKISVEYFLSLVYILYVIYSLDNIAQFSGTEYRVRSTLLLEILSQYLRHFWRTFVSPPYLLSVCPSILVRPDDASWCFLNSSTAPNGRTSHRPPTRVRKKDMCGNSNSSCCGIWKLYMCRSTNLYDK